LSSLKWQYAKIRSISPEALEFFGSKIGVDPEGPQVLVFPYPSGRELVKDLQVKDFFWTGVAKEDHQGGDLFGQDKFPSGGRSITVTEGALDTLSVFDMFDRKYPVVSVKSAQSAKSECAA